MRNKKHITRKRSSGQALVESALLIPFMLMLIFNAVNFGYFYYVALNMSAASRSGALYSILGPNTPVDSSSTFGGGGGYAPAGANTNCGTNSATTCTVRSVTYQDMKGSLPFGDTNANLKICTQSLGVTTTSGIQYANCKTFSSATDTSGTSAGTGLEDPEFLTTGFIMHEVDVTYRFTPLIPGRFFGAVLLATPTCTSSGSITCTLHKKVYMRAM
jgi:Flp pilus assembly protein TadG